MGIWLNELEDAVRRESRAALRDRRMLRNTLQERCAAAHEGSRADSLLVVLQACPRPGTEITPAEAEALLHAEVARQAHPGFLLRGGQAALLLPGSMDAAALKRLDPGKYVDERFGLPTVRDILKELEKPGRDPRPAFKTAAFEEGVHDLKDLKPGMRLEGVVTNVTNFGAFVDVGVHQDGLVHISALSEKFVKDPREVVKAGDIVQVKVMEVDIARRRIALSMRMKDTPPPPGASPATPSRGRVEARAQPAPQSGALAEALRRAAGRN